MRWLLAIALLLAGATHGATFYADSAGSQGSGDGSSAANAATLKQCITNDGVLHTALVAGSTIYVKNGTTITWDGSAGDYVVSAVAGTAAAPIIVIGYASTVTDGGIVEISDSHAANNNTAINIAHTYWVLANIRVTGAGYGFESTDDWISYLNCHSVDAYRSGFTVSTGNIGAAIFVGCSAIRTSSEGGSYPAFTSLARTSMFAHCVAISAVGEGFIADSTAGVTFANCVSHSNGKGYSVADAALFVGCIANRNSDDGYEITGGDNATVMINCGATANGAYGIDGDAGTTVIAANCGLNPTNEANTSGKNSSNVTLLEYGAVAGDPDFADSNPATPANVNLAISAASAWKAAGAAIGGDGWSSTASNMDIGPSQRLYDLPAVGNVTEDDTVEDATGTYHEATEAEVQSGVQFGEDGTEYTGTYSGGGGGPVLRQGRRHGL